MIERGRKKNEILEKKYGRDAGRKIREIGVSMKSMKKGVENRAGIMSMKLKNVPYLKKRDEKEREIKIRKSEIKV